MEEQDYEGEYSEAGIREEDILSELTCLMDQRDAIIQSMSPYEDHKESLKRIINSRRISEKDIAFFVKNTETYSKKYLQAIEIGARISQVCNLYEKYFPDCQYSKMNGLKEKIKEMAEIDDTVKNKIKNSISLLYTVFLKYIKAKKQQESRTA